MTLTLATAACSRATIGPLIAQHPALRVVTTSNILGDWVRRVGGSRVEVFSLLPMGAYPHTFQPSVRDVTRVADADLL